jgi:hypothetical protein
MGGACGAAAMLFSFKAIPGWGSAAMANYNSHR